MNKMTGLWPWPVNHTLYQRLRSSEFQRIRAGKLAAPKRPNHGPVASVRHRHCQWPDGEPREEEFRFCGAPTASGRSYCAAHCARAFLPEDGSEPAAPADIARDLPEEIAADELWPDPPPPELPAEEA
jgi:hypothetical protein